VNGVLRPEEQASSRRDSWSKPEAPSWSRGAETEAGAKAEAEARAVVETDKAFTQVVETVEKSTFSASQEKSKSESIRGKMGRDNRL